MMHLPSELQRHSLHYIRFLLVDKYNRSCYLAKDIQRLKKIPMEDT